VNIHSKRKLNIKDLNTFNNDNHTNNNNNINNINISLDFKKPQSKYPLTNIFESQDITNTNYDDNSFQTKHNMITSSENKHKHKPLSIKDNNKNKSYTIRTNIISSNYIHNAYIKSKQLLKNSKSLNTHYNKYLTSTDNNNNNDNDNDDQLISFTPTPHQKKPKPLILWNNLSKFILNQSSVGPNSLKKITLDQISSKAKKLSSIKRIKLKKQQHHTEQQQYKQHSNINNIKTTQSIVVHNTLTDNNNINSSAISLFTKSNMSYIKDTSINNQSHKTSISPIYKSHYNQPQTTMFIRANLGGNKGDLCLKHSTIVNNLFKNK
jgi:hypothetical protein